MTNGDLLDPALVEALEGMDAALNDVPAMPAARIWAVTEQGLGAVVEHECVFHFSEYLEGIRWNAHAARSVLVARLLGAIAPHISAVWWTAEDVEGEAGLMFGFLDEHEEPVAVAEWVGYVARACLGHPAFIGDLMLATAEAGSDSVQAVDLVSLREPDTVEESPALLRVVAARLAAEYFEDPEVAPSVTAMHLHLDEMSTMSSPTVWALTEAGLGDLPVPASAEDYTDTMVDIRNRASIARALLMARLLREVAPPVQTVMFRAEAQDGVPGLALWFLDDQQAEIEVGEAVSKVVAGSLGHAVLVPDLVVLSEACAEGPNRAVSLHLPSLLQDDESAESPKALRELFSRIVATYEETSAAL